MSKCSVSASASGSALGFAVAKVLIIGSSETLTISLWSTDGAGTCAGGTGGKYGLLKKKKWSVVGGGGGRKLVFHCNFFFPPFTVPSSQDKLAQKGLQD